MVSQPPIQEREEEMGSSRDQPSAGHHTPGKWVARRCGELAPSCWNVVAEFGENERGIRQVRTIDQVLDYCGADEAEANARLIAAAPDLLASAKALVKAVELENSGIETRDDDWVYDELRAVGLAYLQARAAIAKAEGRS